MLKERKTLAKYLEAQLQEVAQECGERVLHVPFNDVRLVRFASIANQLLADYPLVRMCRSRLR